MTCVVGISFTIMQHLQVECLRAKMRITKRGFSLCKSSPWPRKGSSLLQPTGRLLRMFAQVHFSEHSLTRLNMFMLCFSICGVDFRAGKTMHERVSE